MQGIAGWIAESIKDKDPAQLRSMVYLMQAGMGAFFVVGFWWIRGRNSGSGFGARESELRKKAATFQTRDELAKGRLESKPAPLRLSGISIQGAPHEILGIAPAANAAEIQKAYRDLMKRYHPDVVARPGTSQWKEAQKIAEAINRAKQEMLSRAKTN